MFYLKNYSYGSVRQLDRNVFKSEIKKRGFKLKLKAKRKSSKVNFSGFLCYNNLVTVHAIDWNKMRIEALQIR